MEPPIRDSESNPKPLSENKRDPNGVFIDTNLDTHLAVPVSDHETVSDLKERILSEHPSCFPKLGQIQIHAMKVKRKGKFYHLADSMVVKHAFYGFNKSWFVSVDASPFGKPGQNDCSGSPNQQILLGNSDNALIGLINDEKEEHDFVNPSDKAVKDDNVVREDEMSNSVSSAKEKQKSARKDDTAEYDASVLRPGNDAVQEIEVMADPSLNASKEVIIQSEVLREHQHTEFNDNRATIGIGTESMKEASKPARATNKQKKSKRYVIHDADVGEKKGKKRSSNSHETHLTSFRKDAEADASNIREGVQEEIYEDGIISKDISMSKPMLEKMEIGTDASLEGIPSKVKKSKKHNRSDVVLGLSALEKSEKKKRKTRKDKDSNVGTTVGEGIGRTDSSVSKNVIVKSLKSSDCDPASGDIGAEENPLNHTEVENIQQAEMKGTVVSATEKNDASGADNLGSLEQIETIANAEHVDKTRRKKSNKKQSNSHGRKRLESGEQDDFKGSMSSIKGKPIDRVLRSSSRFKLTRITSSQVEGSESQPEFVPDSLETEPRWR